LSKNQRKYHRQYVDNSQLVIHDEKLKHSFIIKYVKIAYFSAIHKE